jgi:hypothetical protein
VHVHVAFSDFKAGTPLHRLNSAPKHTLSFYVRIWRALELYNVGGATTPSPAPHLLHPLQHFALVMDFVSFFIPSSQAQATKCFTSQ